MKYYIVSDIHGSSKNIKKVLEYFDEDGDYLLILGDILYHGPRNDIPENYEPKEVIQLLNERKDKILAVRGNCDGEVDQMVLNFPITSDYLMFPFDEYKIFMTHGHLYKEFLWMNENDVILSGHTHIPVAKKEDGKIFLNPGSVSIPKMNHVPSFAILDNHTFTIYDLDKNIMLSYKLR